MPVRCNDGGPARNHWFVTIEEARAMPRLKSAGFWSVCSPTVKTFQIRNPKTGRTGEILRSA
jgi:hypothetical protein